VCAVLPPITSAINATFNAELLFVAIRGVDKIGETVVVIKPDVDIVEADDVVVVVIAHKGIPHVQLKSGHAVSKLLKQFLSFEVGEINAHPQAPVLGNILQCVRNDGINPVKAFPLTESNVRLDKDEISVGSDPVNMLFSRPKAVNLVNNPISDGKDPVHELLTRLKAVKFVNNPISVCTDPK